MVWPILISVSVIPGALAARADRPPKANAATAPAPDCRSERRVVMFCSPALLSFARRNAPPEQKVKSRMHQHGLVGELLPEKREVAFEIVARNKATVDQRVAHIIDEVPKDRAPTVPDRMNMNGQIDVDVGQPCVAEKPVGASADVKIDPPRTRMRVVGGAQPRIFGRRRIHRLRLDVRLEARDPAPRA